MSSTTHYLSSNSITENVNFVVLSNLLYLSNLLTFQIYWADSLQIYIRLFNAQQKDFLEGFLGTKPMRVSAIRKHCSKLYWTNSGIIGVLSLSLSRSCCIVFVYMRRLQLDAAPPTVSKFFLRRIAVPLILMLSSIHRKWPQVPHRGQNKPSTLSQMKIFWGISYVVVIRVPLRWRLRNTAFTFPILCNGIFMQQYVICKTSGT